MADPTILVTLASTGLVAVSVTIAAALKGWQGWQGWLELKRMEMQQGTGATPARLDVSDLKERVRKLEAIAAGEV